VDAVGSRVTPEGADRIRKAIPGIRFHDSRSLGLLR
jgi:hypothetical protein